MEQRRVLVTGASGFIGRHVLCDLVSCGYAVHATGRTVLADPSRAVQWHAADLLFPGAAEALIREVRPSHLLHLAWTATPGAFWTAPENLDWVAASITLYRAFVAAGGRRAVLAGTCAEYDWSDPLLDEQTTPCAPGTLYGAAKDALHRVLRQAAADDGVALAWGRVFWLYGPHEARARLVPSVVLPLLRGEPALCGDGTAERDFMHVADVARALTMTLDSDYAGPVNLASGICVPVGDIIGLIAERIGRRDLVRLGARASRPDEPRRLAAAVTILRDRIGFVPRHDLAEGLEATIAWWRDRL